MIDIDHGTMPAGAGAARYRKYIVRNDTSDTVCAATHAASAHQQENRVLMTKSGNQTVHAVSALGARTKIFSIDVFRHSIDA
jgi:hypothetical protein